MLMCRLEELKAAARTSAADEQQSAATIQSLLTEIAFLESTETMGVGASGSASKVRDVK